MAESVLLEERILHYEWKTNLKNTENIQIEGAFIATAEVKWTEWREEWMIDSICVRLCTFWMGIYHMILAKKE